MGRERGEGEKGEGREEMREGGEKGGGQGMRREGGRGWINGDKMCNRYPA